MMEAIEGLKQKLRTPGSDLEVPRDDDDIEPGFIYFSRGNHSQCMQFMQRHFGLEEAAKICQNQDVAHYA